MTIDQFRVADISCEHCVRAITKEVSAVPGVHQVVVDLNDKSVRVEHEDSVNATVLMQAIKDAGYDEIAVLA